MKTIALLLTSVCLVAEEITELGTVSPRRGIILEKCQRRTDFLEWKLEFLPQTHPTNQVNMVTTNELLTLPLLAQLPSGPVIMGVRQVCTDGTESPISLFRFTIRRGDPSSPRAMGIGILTGVQGQSLTNRLERIRQRRAAEALQNTPPIPGQTVTNAPTVQPMPESRNRTYGEYLDEMAQHYRRTTRRSE